MKNRYFVPHAPGQTVSTVDLSYQRLNESHILVSSGSYDFVERSGAMVAIDRESGATEGLPATGIDLHGNSVTLYYKPSRPGTVTITAILSGDSVHKSTEVTAHTRAKRKGEWCWLGIVGSGIGGALAGAAAGSAIPVVGTAIGGFAGAISGNAIGTANYC